MGITEYELSESSRIVFELVWRLPCDQYVVYSDNFFTNTKLATALRSIGVALCGTCKADSGYPKDLLRLRASYKKQAEWGKKVTEIADNVCCLAWTDNNVVQLMTNAHSTEYVEEEVVWMDAKKRAGIPQEAAHKKDVCIDIVDRRYVCISWKNKIPKPAAVHEYNRHMGGVDQNAQARAVYHCRRRCLRYWHALFVYVIEVAIQNAFRLHQMFYTTVEVNMFSLKDRQDFLVSLAYQLISLNAGQAVKRAQGFAIFEDGDGLDVEHVMEHIPAKKRQRCWSCTQQTLQRPSRRLPLALLEPNIPHGRTQASRTDPSHIASQTVFQCRECQKPCCKNRQDGVGSCWAFMHQQDVIG